jgi:hypothetical protein
MLLVTTRAAARRLVASPRRYCRPIPIVRLRKRRRYRPSSTVPNAENYKFFAMQAFMRPAMVVAMNL